MDSWLRATDRIGKSESPEKKKGKMVITTAIELPLKQTAMHFPATGQCDLSSDVELHGVAGYLRRHCCCNFAKVDKLLCVAKTQLTALNNRGKRLTVIKD